MLLLSIAGTEETREGEKCGRVQYGREGQTWNENRIVQTSFNSVGSLAKSYDPHKENFVHTPRAYGKSEGEVCPMPRKGLCSAATSCCRVPVSLTTQCNIPHANSSIQNYIPLTWSQRKYLMKSVCHAQIRQRNKTFWTHMSLWIVVSRQFDACGTCHEYSTLWCPMTSILDF